MRQTIAAVTHLPSSTLLDVVMRFGTSGERRHVLQGWLAHRAALHHLGLVSGFQWIDGSFVEDVETLRGRAPNDVDVVSFVDAPAALPLQDPALDQRVFAFAKERPIAAGRSEVANRLTPPCARRRSPDQRRPDERFEPSTWGCRAHPGRAAKAFRRRAPRAPRP